MHDEEMAIAIVAVVFGVPMIVLVFSIFMKGVVRIVCHWRDVSLKIRLAERGMAAYEIEQVVQAGRVDGCRRTQVSQPSPATISPGKPPKADYAVRY